MTRRRGRAWVRWTLLGATVVVLAADGLSLVRTVGTGAWHTSIGIGGGSLLIFYQSDSPAQGWAWEPSMPLLPWLPRLVGTDPGSLFWLPLWIPAVVFGLASVVTWWKWWRWRPPGTCRNCGYDRAGLATGALCPECGAGAKA